MFHERGKIAGCALGLITALFANNGTAQTGVVEEVVVTAKTGSRIGRQGDSPSPLSNYEAGDLLDAGLKDIRDLVGVLAINAGAENNSDNLTQNYTAGTANVNLRGLGVASTLVLLNGRRQVLSAVQTDDGSSFVDLAALVPMLAVERVEILKDGAAAIYGSEAVAGVANFITRRRFAGFELQAEYRGRTNDGTQEDFSLDAVYGGALGDGVGEFLLAASYLDRTSLVLTEVDWLRPATSGFGNPGSFNVPSLGRTVADPGCERYGGLLQDLSGGSEICRFDYGPQLTAVPSEQRLQAWGRATWRWGRGSGALGRTRLRPQRHQPRCVAEFPGAQHTGGAGLPSGQSIRRGCAVPGPPVRLRASAGDQLLQARNPPLCRRPLMGGSRRRCPGISPWCGVRAMPCSTHAM